MRLPRSLRGQFKLALSILSMLTLAGGSAAIYALRISNEATQRLADERLMRTQQAHRLVERTLLIEQETERMLRAPSLRTVGLNYTTIVAHLAELDSVVDKLAQSADEGSVLDLHQASQLFRNTANIVAQLRQSALRADEAFLRSLRDRTDMLQARPGADAAALTVLLYRLGGATQMDAVEPLRREFFRRAGRVTEVPADMHQPSSAGSSSSRDLDSDDPFLLRLKAISQREALDRFHEQLEGQAYSMVAIARLQSDHLDEDYRLALARVVEMSSRHQRWVLALLGCSLLFTWLVSGVFLGRHVLRRLQQVNLHLQQRGTTATPLAALVLERDEIGDMARAVDSFLADRSHLEQRTAELRATKERAIEQGRVLELIATEAPLSAVLDRLTQLIESHLDGITGSILLLSDDGLHLLHGAAPGLPATYSAAIDGLRIGPTVGSCGTAAHRRETVIVADIQNDPLWADYRTLAEHHALRSCWSAPILSPQGAVLGTFAMYSASVRVPSAADAQVIELATRIAGIAIERQRSKQRMRHMAHHDELTGLPNRALLDDRLRQGLAHARRTGRPMALLFLDLDDFKFVNDSFGHPVGDALLKEVASRLLALVRESDTVARLGGDEFVLMLLDLEHPDDAVRLAQQILEALGAPVQVDGRSLHIGTSIGISVYPQDGGSADLLLMHADVAMYRSKQRGRNSYQCYTEDMGRQARQHTELQAALHLALDKQQFELVYQPQVDLRSGRVNGMEALIRWHHPELGTVSPARFIPVAEETGLIVSIGEWVLRTACTQLKAWHAAGHSHLSVAVNLSARQFQGHDVAQLVRRVLADCQMTGEFLELELTESALMLDSEVVLQALRELKALGVMLALDDFGTGYSSLNHLRRFPIDVIKIDQSFTRDLGDSAETASITRAIIAMARSLGVKTIAEGLETEQQLRFMADQRCDSVQGFYFSRPLSAAAMSTLLSEDRRLLVGAAAPNCIDPKTV